MNSTGIFAIIVCIYSFGLNLWRIIQAIRNKDRDALKVQISVFLLLCAIAFFVFYL